MPIVVYMACKSCVSVNHMYCCAMYNIIFSFAGGECKYLSNTLTWSHVNVLGSASVFLIYL